MKIICSLSSIEFSCDHFPGTFYSPTVHHPVFSLPQKRLLSYTGKWAASELTATDSYLLFLAILNTSDLIDWRTSAIRTARTDSIVANNMEALLKIIIKINTIPAYEEVFPHYAISQDTRSLDNIQYWIANWQDCYDNFKKGYKSAHESAIIIRRENALARLIKSPHRSISSYAIQLSDWAAIAGSFPTFSIPLLATNCTDYWKDIIIKCAKNDNIFSIPDNDLSELLTHCRETIPNGTIYSHALFDILEKATARKKTFLDLGDPDLHTTYQILADNTSVEAANLIALMNSAPSTEPLRTEYPSEFLFIRAMNRFRLNKKFGNSPTQRD